MLQFLPVKSNEDIKAYIKKSNIDTAENIFAFYAMEDDSNAGFCLYTVKGANVYLLHISYDKSKSYISEGLIRAVINSAALLHGAYIVYVDAVIGDNIHLPYGFSKHGNVYNGEIPEILAGNCMNSCNIS